MNIFNIDKQLEHIYAEIEDNDGEITPDIEEALAVTEANFKSKIESYCELVKQVTYDVEAVNSEIMRLQDLKKRKLGSLESIKRLLVSFIEKYGEVTKSGNKYIDYGIGKVSVRSNKVCVTNDTLIDSVSSGLFSYLNMLAYNKQLQCTDGLEDAELLDAIEEYTGNDNVSLADIKDITTNISFDIPLADLIKGDGYRFVGSFIDYIKDFKTKSKVNKTELKKLIDDGSYSALANVEINKTVQIK